ncbi:hypothetical protein VTI28DRAFT_5137 [Corynascus sepedonium]
MALNRIDGADELYIGGVFGLNRPGLIQEHNFTHILSVIKYSLNREEDAFRHVEHLCIDIDDMDDQDILVHLPRMVRFIDKGLRHDEEPVSSTLKTPSKSPPSGTVLVHCAMGKSRSATAVIAYLLWRYPRRFSKSDPAVTAKQAVAQALKWVRGSRPVAEPNDGFMRQLEMWWDMGRPADSDDAVEKHPAYQRWLYKREVEDAARIGRAPDWIRFEDEAAAAQESADVTPSGEPAAGPSGMGQQGAELRCKKCRRVLATGPFIVPHRQGTGHDAGRPGCPHYFVEALSWMRPILEEGELDGRLICPNDKCSASIGRYAWQGFKCSCGEWVAPAFSLQTSKVDKVVTGGNGGGSASIMDRMAALGIRMPPGAGSSPGAARSSSELEKSKENL